MPIYKQESGDDNNIILNLTSACSCRWRLIDYLRARQPGATAADAQDVSRIIGLHISDSLEPKSLHSGFQSIDHW